MESPLHAKNPGSDAWLICKKSADAIVPAERKRTSFRREGPNNNGLSREKKFALQIEPSETRLVEFGRYSDKHAKERNTKMETICFLGVTHFCTRNRSGNFMVGRKTEKSRLRRNMIKLTSEIRRNRHEPPKKINGKERIRYSEGITITTDSRAI